MNISNRQRRTTRGRSSPPVDRVQILPFGMGIACLRRAISTARAPGRCRACLSPGRQSRARRRTGGAACMPAWPQLEAAAAIYLLRPRPAGQPVSDPHHSWQEKTAAGPRRWPWRSKSWGRGGGSYLTGLWLHRSWQRGSCTGRQLHGRATVQWPAAELARRAS
jgi:hypothetical protein